MAVSPSSETNRVDLAFDAQGERGLISIPHCVWRFAAVRIVGALHASLPRASPVCEVSPLRSVEIRKNRQNVKSEVPRTLLSLNLSVPSVVGLSRQTWTMKAAQHLHSVLRGHELDADTYASSTTGRVSN